MDLIQQAKERHAQLKAQIEAAEAVRPEFERLDAFLEEAEKIGLQLAHPELTQHRETIARNILRSRAFGVDGELTGDLAEKALEIHGGGPLHVQAILDEIYKMGWVGSGNRNKDYKNLWQNLSDKPKRFRSHGKSMFEKLKEGEKTEQGR